MKIVMSLIFAIALTGCGTLGGAITGAGDDLQKAGNWIKNK